MIKNLHPNPKSANSIDDILQQLDDIINESILANNYLCIFAYVYRRTTLEIKKAIESGRFEDSKRMEKMDVIFANLYIQAFQKNNADKVSSKSWDFAFNAKDKKLSLIQHIMLGMNAHINLDLSIAAAEVSNGERIINLKVDFMTINHILAELTQTMQKSLGKVSFLLKLLDIFGFQNDEKIIDFSIKKAREFAWSNAMELALLKGKKKQSRIIEIDGRVQQLSRMISNPPGLLLKLVLKLISIFETKDPKKLIVKMKNA